MMYILFKTCLLLAVVPNSGPRKPYHVIATISLATLKISSVEEDTGLDCATTPYSWKVIFEADSKAYELLMVASNFDEAREWKNAVNSMCGQEICRTDLFSMVYLDLKSIGHVIGRPGSLLRRIAMRETGTKCRQVIIKNTQTEGLRVVNTNVVERLSATTLVAKRAELTQMEEEIQEVWSGPGCQRPKQIRASASSLLRKLSRSSKSKLNIVG
jgi:hypothetical protein